MYMYSHGYEKISGGGEGHKPSRIHTGIHKNTEKYNKNVDEPPSGYQTLYNMPKITFDLIWFNSYLCRSPEVDTIACDSVA